MQKFLGAIPTLPHPQCQAGAPVNNIAFARNVRNARNVSILTLLYPMAQHANYFNTNTPGSSRHGCKKDRIPDKHPPKNAIYAYRPPTVVDREFIVIPDGHR